MKKEREPRTKDGDVIPPVFPMRINKYLAMEGRGSRRDMDKLIAGGKILINDKVAVLGSKVNEGDKVEIRFHKVKEGNK